MISCKKVIVSVPQLLQLAPSKCLLPNCLSPLSCKTQFKGCGLLLHFSCTMGHTYSWTSSAEHLDKAGNSVHSNNLLLGVSCLLSGNSFTMIAKMLRFMGVKVFSNHMFYR